MRVMITGGCGFIGSQLVREFVSRGDRVTVFDCLTYSGFKEHLDGVEAGFFKGDLRNTSDIVSCFNLSHGFDLVIHAAAESSVDKSIQGCQDFITSNIQGSVNLFEVCLDRNVQKIVNFGTDEVYGHLGTEDSSFTEKTPINPRNPYSASKAGQLMFAKAYFETHKLPVVNVCPSNCFGPRQLPEKLLPRMIYLLSKNKELPVYGTGKNIREWLFVEDVAKAVATVAEKGVIGETYNIGSDNENTNLDILTILGKVMGVEPVFKFIEDRKGHDFRYSVNFSKLKKLGWNPSANLEESIKTTVEWYRNHFEWLETNYKKIWA